MILFVFPFVLFQQTLIPLGDTCTFRFRAGRRSWTSCQVRTAGRRSPRPSPFTCTSAARGSSPARCSAPASRRLKKASSQSYTRRAQVECVWKLISFKGGQKRIQQSLPKCTPDKDTLCLNTRFSTKTNLHFSSMTSVS